MSAKEFFRGVRKGFNKFGHCISTIINSILLFVVYIIGVGLTSLSAKLFNKHFLELKPSKKEGTYWSDLDLKKRSVEEHLRQF